MAITIVQSPSKYTPANNPIIFQVSSNNSAIVYFKVEILEASTNTVMSMMDAYVTPDVPQGSYINISKVLSSAVKWEVENSMNLLSAPMDKPILSYKVRFTERGITGGSIGDLGSPVTTSQFEVWEADFNRISFHDYNYTDYVITTGIPARFLTDKPNGTEVNDFSFEQLYFMHDSEDDLRVIVNLYDNLGNLLNTYSHSIGELSSNHLFRLQVSPKSLKESLLASFTGVDNYTIHLEDENGDRKTEQRKYVYKTLPCHLEPTNLVWVNSFGGVDSYQFVNVQESNQITKTSYKRNIFRVDNGLYSDRTGDIWNAADETIDVSQQGTYTATSRFITDDESYWFNGLFTSKQVFVELADNSLAPVMVTNNSYQIQRQKYNKQNLNHIQVTYTFSGDIIPASALDYTTGFGNGTLQLDFIDKQMNYTSAFDTILVFTSSATTGAEGVGAAVASINSNQKFEFNKITPLLGLYHNMTITVGGVTQTVIDYHSDYTTKQFRYTDLSGVAHYGTFTNGTVAF